MGKTICIDFDGVIHDYSNGYQGPDVFGSMVPNADAGTQALKRNGWTVIIFTTRKKSDKMEQWLKDHGISYDYINENPNQPKDTSGKIMADVYLDDRGIRFCGRWDKWLLEDIMTFETWQEAEKKEMESIKNFSMRSKDIWEAGGYKVISHPNNSI